MRFFVLSLLTTFLFTFPASTFAQRTYAESSVLSEGNWYKIGVVETGVYRLDRSFFDNLGLDPNSLDPRQIRIFGNGGGMLPQANDEFRHDDLVENAIFVSGEADGSLDNGDQVLFYAQGPHVWRHHASLNAFRHELHLYSDTNYYYLNVGQAEGRRIEEIPSESNHTFIPASTIGLRFHENDQENLIKSGRKWMGEKFDLITERSFSFHLPDADPNGEVTLRLRLAARSDRTTGFSVEANGTPLGLLNINSVNVTNNETQYYRPREGEFTIPGNVVSGDSLRIKLLYNKQGSSRAEGWLDWIEVAYEQMLDTRGANLHDFHLMEGVGANAVARFSVRSGSNAYRIWDVTDPVNVSQRAYSLNGSAMQFNAYAEEPRHFIAFKGGYLSPISASPISNQNLHEPSLYDYVIFSYEDFGPEAERLAEFHRNHYGRTVKVVYPQELYNEFSSGKQDVSAYRDYLKMIWDRSGGTHPRWALFFGDGSYDYKNITRAPTVRNFLPTYQSRASTSPTTSFTSDDFFTMLDEGEGNWGEGTGGGDVYERNLMDVAIGRLPIESIDEAAGLVDKIINYVTRPESFGDWRNRVVLVADHKEGEGYTHVSQADAYTSLINRYDPCINLEKIYLDNYPVENTAAGTFFPQGREALLDQLDRGSLLVNYTGHGGEYAWSNSRILNLADIQSMDNGNRLPAIVTATCEFGRFDDQDRRSGAEIFVARPDGGAIALFTTVRLVYSSPNATLNRNFYHEVFRYDSVEQRMPTMGEIMMHTKNRTFPLGQTTDINSRNFTLLGDPGLILVYPELQARVTEINGTLPDPSLQDTLRSLSKVTVKGMITDDLGITQPDFQGKMAITVFDKPSKFLTRLAPFPFYWQTNRIFNGNASVENGEFSFEFVVPIDVSYEDGKGKFSFYFQGEEIDGKGCYSSLYVGGTDESVAPDTEGPQVDLYINNADWKDGGTTGSNPYLYAVLSDENGINLVASGIGHEIIGVLDDNEDNIIILNDFYTAELDDYRKGSVYYQLKNLEDGPHSLKIRVWDVANNWAEARTNFIVGSDARLALNEVLNYPNPFVAGQAETRFLLGFTQTQKEYDVAVRIMGEDGRVVKVLSGSFFADGNYYRGLSWDGLTERGNPVNSGLYVYQVILTDKETGETVHNANKLVVIK